MDENLEKMKKIDIKENLKKMEKNLQKIEKMEKN